MRAAWAAVAPRYTGRRIVIYGRSLGSGLAAGLAVELQPDLTVLVSPYTSFGALAREHYRWVPAALLRYPLATDQQDSDQHRCLQSGQGQRTQQLFR